MRDKATSVYALTNDIDRAKDWNGRTNLAYQAGAAKPLFSGHSAGLGLICDGGDECYATVPTVTAPPAWMACSFRVGSVAASQAGCGLGSSNPTFGAFMAFLLNSGSGRIMVQIRLFDGASATDIDGPTAIIGKVYHCAFVTRAANDHVLYVNGIRYASTTSITTGSSFVTMGIGCLRRAATSFQLTGQTYWAAYGTRDPGERFLRELSVNPWRHLFKDNTRSIIGFLAADFNRRRRVFIGAGCP